MFCLWALGVNNVKNFTALFDGEVRQKSHDRFFFYKNELEVGDMELKLIFIKNVLSVGHGATQCAYTSVWSTKKQALKINPHICRPKTTTQAKAGW